ncbi:hypothetical protein PYW08_014377 [Mythimna loreyi]|uniref:Uncharacterized protein n=1 Tax=Mythimna loreyi TaxID=667449 RepID=A0ACC2R7V9_9NEOP|nr:hypothetical protein PYW08_014377 [Mythimna loreyi]
MYRCNFVLVLCVVGVVRASDAKAKASADFRVIDSIYNEEPCTSQGGLCTLEIDCPRGHILQEKGLCPAQRSKGVECCYGLSVKETRCEKRGGICMPGREPCNKDLRFTEAIDCPKEHTCCILVK